MLTYKTARKDFEFLESIAELSDQQVLDEQRLGLMQNPTKERASQLYQAGVRLWFNEHGISEQTLKVAKRHNINP